MMNDMNVSLPKALEDGAAQERLETLLLEGLESGDPVLVTPDFWKQLWERVDTGKTEKHSR
ncbi:MAG: hypothetical protein ABIY70_05295 [Capsulimonas sp.]|uniref:hypothetical protein n=1 Tax=Capsulimonas sp. TaxID=2494211 RepID=UPI0032644F54